MDDEAHRQRLLDLAGEGAMLVRADEVKIGDLLHLGGGGYMAWAEVIKADPKPKQVWMRCELQEPFVGFVNFRPRRDDELVVRRDEF